MEPIPKAVIPAKAGIQVTPKGVIPTKVGIQNFNIILDSGFRRNDEGLASRLRGTDSIMDFIMPVPSRHYRFIIERDGNGVHLAN
ncbi:MAG: hypothetical protein LHV69_06385 [Elusimicrobia bacterium]|nr:hypothetical protein [Candidatus Obscuribacterium magneticum]